MINRRYRIVADAIAEHIYRGEFKVGDRLPPERELAETYDVSRPVIREALIALEISGLVEVRRSAGVYVNRIRDQPLQVNVFERGVNPFELIDARRLIECQNVAEAAKIITDRELLGLEQALQHMKDSFTDLERYEEYDRGFHILIAKAARNTLLTAVIDNLWALHTRGRIWNQLHKFIPREKLHGDRLDEHVAIYQALKLHDPDRARQAMDVHLSRAKETLLNAANKLKENDDENAARKPR